MREIVIEYWPKDEAKRDLRIKEIHPGCEVCGVVMTHIGNAGCAHDNAYTYFYQCPSCKLVETSKSPFGHYHYGIHEEDSAWEPVPLLQDKLE